MNVAIYGGGSIGQRHAANAQTLGHQVKVFDINESRGVHPHNGYIAQQFRPDAVLICTPASEHESVARLLRHIAYAGPLFVEKPLALRLPAVIFGEWPHPTTMVGYNWRFHPDVAPLRAIARTGSTLHFDCRTDMRRWPGTTYSDPLLECSHELDLACAWLGTPAAVQGGVLAPEGAWVQLLHPAGDSLIDVRWRSEASRRLSIHRRGCSVHVTLDIARGAAALNESYLAELRHFLEAARLERPTAIPFADGLRVVEICTRVKELAA
jgi:predicted dehydrogenase